MENNENFHHFLADNDLVGYISFDEMLKVISRFNTVGNIKMQYCVPACLFSLCNSSPEKKPEKR